MIASSRRSVLRWLLVRTLEVKVQVISFQEGCPKYVGQFSGNHVFLSPLQQAVRGGVEVVVDTVEGGPLSRGRVPGDEEVEKTSFT